ncbi:FAD dependent oxidoreductase [Chlamydoabsidia padenii]|nr:FAD dependent oxidoreductase [Chlamydoabsidia padenii]
MHILIVGAGAMGTCTTYYLAQRPDIKITVVEKTNVACASSGKAGGFLWSEGDGELSKKSYQLHSELAATLLGDELYGYRTLNTYSVTMTSEENQGSVKQCKKVNDHVPWLNQQRVTHCDELGTKNDTAQVHPRLFVNTLMSAAVATGNVNLITGIGVERLLYENRKEPRMVTGALLDNGDKVLADRVVLCLGPWSETFPLKKMNDGVLNDMITRHHVDDPLGEDDGLPVYSVRAHSIVMQLPPTSPIGAQALFTAILDGSKMYEPEVYPRPDHTVYMCGAQDNKVPLPASADLVQVDPAAIAQLKNLAPKLSCHLQADNMTTTEQACYLPISRDGAPLVGKHPHYKHLYVSAGHSVWGILLSPVSGLMMSELLIDGRITCVDASLVSKLALDSRVDNATPPL